MRCEPWPPARAVRGRANSEKLRRLENIAVYMADKITSVGVQRTAWAESSPKDKWENRGVDVRSRRQTYDFYLP